MLTRVILCLIMLLSDSSFCQQNKFTAPDYKNIEKTTQDKTSKFFYPKLISRYKANDTTLTLEEIHMLYYGYFYNDEGGTTVYNDRNYRDSTNAIYKKETLTDDDRKLLIRYYLAEHNDYFFHLRTLMALHNIYRKLNDPQNRYYLFKVRSLVKVILATGDGKTTKSGYHITSVPDEYDMLSVLGYESTSQSLIGQNDYLALKPNEDSVAGVYFNVEQIFAGYSKAFNKADHKDFLKETGKKKGKSK